MQNTGSIVNHFKTENEGWKRMIAFMVDENVHLKNLLSGTVKDLNINDGILLEKIEYFQNQFLGEDDKIKYLKEDINEQGKWLLRDVDEDRLSLTAIKKQQNRLRKELETREQQFNKLKFEFNNYLSKNL